MKSTRPSCITSSAVSPRPLLRGLLFAAVTLVLLPAWLRSADAPIAVFTQTFNGYQRTRLPDRSFKPETYAFGEGGTDGLDEPRAGAGKLTFMRVARAAAHQLTQANYVPASNPNETSLLITVFWGRTIGSQDADHTNVANVQPGSYAPSSTSRGLGSYGTSLKTSSGNDNDGENGGYGGAPGTGTALPRGSGGAPDSAPRKATDNGLHSAGAQNGLFDPNMAKMNAMIEQADFNNLINDRTDDDNARILGYSQALYYARNSPQVFISRDVLDEVSRNHYYVVLQAYDFHLAWKEKKLKLLWEARISIEEDDGNDFNKEIERMLAAATRVLGKDRGLLRHSVPKGSVTTGPLEVLEYMPPTK